MSEQQTVQFIAQLIQQSIDQHDFDVPMLPEVANKGHYCYHRIQKQVPLRWPH
jgi:hypothetical protein